MTSSEQHKILRELRNTRNEAARHLKRIEKQQSEQPIFIPQVAYAVGVDLADYIERMNERIDLMEQQFTSGDSQYYLQSAFEFLYDIAIKENEIPF